MTDGSQSTVQLRRRPAVGNVTRGRSHCSGFGLGTTTLSFISVIVGGVLWQVIAVVWQPTALPPLTDVLREAFDLVVSGEIIPHVSTSLQNLALGFGISVAVGIVVGVCMAWFPLVEAALDPYVYALFTAPILVFAPILMTIFGVGREPIVGVIVLYTVFLIIINTCAGVKSVSAELIEMGISFNGSHWQLLRLIAMPAAAPMIMAGLRLGMGRAVKGMINGEMFIAVVGLGGIVKRAGSAFDSTKVLAIVILIVALALLLSGVLRLLENRLTGWLPSVTR